MRKSEKSGRKVLPGIWQLNRTTFVVRAQPRDPRTGKKKNLRRLLEDSTLKEAMAAREELLRSVHEPRSTPTRRETVGDFAAYWLDYKAKRGDLESSTLERYATALGHLSERILESYLDELSVDDVVNWMLKAVQVAPGRVPKRFAASTVNSWLRVLRTLLNDACRLRGLRFNPAAAARPLVESTNLEEPNSLSTDDLARLLDELREAEPALMMAAWTQAFTGLRWGEVSALKWCDLDSEKRILVIRRKVQKGRLVPTTKTNRLRRVAVPESLLEMLNDYRKQLSGAQKASELMFPSSVGKPIWNSRISEALARARKRAGITQRFTSHGFRRSLTDLLREATVDPVVAKAITGHRTDRMREHYSTVRNDDIRRAGDAASALLTPKLRLVVGGKESTEESTAADGTKKAGSA